MNCEFKKSDNGIFRISSPDQIMIGVAGKSANRTDYRTEGEESRRNEKIFLRQVTGIAEKNILMLNQVHGDSIVHVTGPPAEDLLYYGDADGMITDIPGICFVIRSADCVPVIAYDRKKNVMGAVHSGWRGCRMSISGKLIMEMRRLYDSRSADISVYILPSIGPESYTVKEDVASFFRDDITVRNDVIYFDMWKNIGRSLIDNGVLKENIHYTGICTLQNTREFFSYRNRDTGRNLNFCYLSGAG